MKTLYISGPITGYENGNRGNFEAADRYLLSRGDRGLVPYDIKPFCLSQFHSGAEPSCEEWPGNPRSNGHTWACWLRGDLIGMLECDGIVTLPGWERSSGAVLEVTTGLRVGMSLEHLTAQDLRTFGGL